MTDIAKLQLRWPKPNERYELCCWLGAHLLGGLLPIWGGILVVVIAGGITSLHSYIEHGEFALLAAGLLAGSLFLLLRDLKVPFPGRLAFGIFTAILLVVATLIFAAVYIRTQEAANLGQKVNLFYLGWTSITLYSVSLLISVVITFIDMMLLNYNPLAVQESEESDLARQFKALKGE